MPDIDDLTSRPVPMWNRYKGVAVAYGVSMAAWGILSLGFTSALNIPNLLRLRRSMAAT